MTRHPLMTLRHALALWRVPTEELGWMPALEIYEKEGEFVVRAEVPGMTKDEDYHRCEMCHGKFSRAVTLPSSVQAGKVAATYDNGILEITLPKAAEPNRRRLRSKSKRPRPRVRPRPNDLICPAPCPRKN